MSSRDKILSDLRAQDLPDVPLPAVDGQWTVYADPRQQFADVLEAVGGRVLTAPNGEALAAALAVVEPYREASHVWSLVPGVASSKPDWGQITDPHELETLQCCIVPGKFAVAENGAVWITHEQVPLRAALFVTQHLILVVPADQIVQHMHEAYTRISFDQAQFGIFISGPSKTADIEQSLVIGAHGARSLTVVLVGG